MLLLSDRLSNNPVMSLQTGMELARTSDAIIDPRRLIIVAFYVNSPSLESNPSVLHVADIREVGELGYIVDDSTVLMSTEGLVRLQEIIDFNFELIGLPVYDRMGHKLGKVADYAYDPLSYAVQQIYTQQSLFRSISNSSNIIHRDQIISVTNEKIIVESPTIKDKFVENAKAAQSLVNPFRSGSQAEPSDR